LLCQVRLNAKKTKNAKQLHKKGGKGIGKCNLDHSAEDVQQKFNSQSQWLPEDIRSLFHEFLVRNPSQTTLNEMFHLLKKYDLVDEQERKERDRKIKWLILNKEDTKA
jgi:hypothetical protein